MAPSRLVEGSENGDDDDKTSTMGSIGARMFNNSYRTLNFPAFPEMPQVPNWRIRMKTNIDNCTAEMERVWFEAVSKQDICTTDKYETATEVLKDVIYMGEGRVNSKDVARWSKLDRLLRFVTTKENILFALKEELDNAEIDFDKRGDMLNGRQRVQYFDATKDVSDHPTSKLELSLQVIRSKSNGSTTPSLA